MESKSSPLVTEQFSNSKHRSPLLSRMSAMINGKSSAVIMSLESPSFTTRSSTFARSESDKLMPNASKFFCNEARPDNFPNAYERARLNRRGLNTD